MQQSVFPVAHDSQLEDAHTGRQGLGSDKTIPQASVEESSRDRDHLWQDPGLIKLSQALEALTRGPGYDRTIPQG